jgi:hypothetical protein
VRPHWRKHMMILMDKAALTAFARALARAGLDRGLELKHQTWSSLALAALGFGDGHAHGRRCRTDRSR